jgi:hypothetical protein
MEYLATLFKSFPSVGDRTRSTMPPRRLAAHFRGETKNEALTFKIGGEHYNCAMHVL